MKQGHQARGDAGHHEPPYNDAVSDVDPSGDVDEVVIRLLLGLQSNLLRASAAVDRTGTGEPANVVHARRVENERDDLVLTTIALGRALLVYRHRLMRLTQRARAQFALLALSAASALLLGLVAALGIDGLEVFGTIAGLSAFCYWAYRAFQP